ncbi:hypothetical protein S40285_02742 [Stachybotrys chlorohalonatus IBT 40285]|uniref:TauD/TfdA-like domain-containing protein n=1 Tax=Stachybotrys chlorohalonatus (strain IBT 40285) TaxID=1283841 RepID=A0A084QAJ7_STAC4|nr:hypothetical protein S40285_02742 [Stachybotrys chlorohalonata IBT 40285]
MIRLQPIARNCRLCIPQAAVLYRASPVSYAITARIFSTSSSPQRKDGASSTYGRKASGRNLPEASSVAKESENAQNETSLNDGGEDVYPPTPIKGAREYFDKAGIPGMDLQWNPRGIFGKNYRGKSTKSSAATLRTFCHCELCRNKANGQRTFTESAIDPNIRIASVEALPEGLRINFTSEEKRLDKEGTHTSDWPWHRLLAAVKYHVFRGNPPSETRIHLRTKVSYWDAAMLEKRIASIDYSRFKEFDGKWDVITQLCHLGIVIVKNVPLKEESVSAVAERIGPVRETFYGRTFDVKAKPNPDNVAYTAESLGLHQDLLYLHSPPKIQILHCMENTCEGGLSLFSDGERAATALLATLGADHPLVKALMERKVPYQYYAGGRNYYQARRVLEYSAGQLQKVYWSPPFVGDSTRRDMDFTPEWIRAARVFEDMINAEDAVFKFRLEPGDCVLFDNMRVMHGRTAFDSGTGSRWLRGAYISNEDFLSVASMIPRSVLRRSADQDSTDAPIRKGIALPKSSIEDLHKAVQRHGFDVVNN